MGIENATTAISRVWATLKRWGWGEAIVRFLEWIEPWCLFAIAAPLIIRARVYLNDMILSDLWFRWREGGWLDYVTFPVLPACIAFGLTQWFRRSLAKTIHVLVLVLIPISVVLVWYPIFWGPRHFDEHAKEFVVNGKMGCKNSQGEVWIAPMYDRVLCEYLGFNSIGFMGGGTAGNSGEDWIPIQEKGKWGFLNRSSQLAIKPQYDYYGGAHWGLLPVKRGEKWGFVSTRTGEVVIPFDYDGADDFARVRGAGSVWAPVKWGGKWGFIDRTNQVRIPFEFDDVNSSLWWSGRGLFATNRPMRDGWKIVLSVFDDATQEPPSYAQVRVGSMWGMIDSNGVYLLEPSIPGNYTPKIHCDTFYRQCFYEELFVKAHKPETRVTRDTEWRCHSTVEENPARPFPITLPNGHVWPSLEACEAILPNVRDVRE